MSYNINIVYRDGSPFTGTAIVLDDKGGGGKNYINKTLFLNELTQSEITKIGLEPDTPNTWTYIVTDLPKNNDTLFLEKINEKGPLGWWHEYLGIQNGNSKRGNNISLGVIDLDINIEPHLNHVKHYGQIDPSTLTPTITTKTINKNPHGNLVASFACGRPSNTSDLFQGIAPYVDAHFVPVERFENGCPTGLFDPRAVSRAIRFLAEEVKCDIISVSTGDKDNKLKTVYANILNALEHGSLVIFAAGNEKGSVYYPAKYSDVISVGVLGKCGQAPEHTAASFCEQGSLKFDNDKYYFWSENPTDEPLDCIAPGIGLFSSRGGSIDTDQMGSSYSAPIVAGILACQLSNNSDYLKLPRSRQRADFAMNLLKKSIISPNSTNFKLNIGIPVI